MSMNERDIFGFGRKGSGPGIGALLAMLSGDPSDLFADLLGGRDTNDGLNDDVRRLISTPARVDTHALLAKESADRIVAEEGNRLLDARLTELRTAVIQMGEAHARAIETAEERRLRDVDSMRRAGESSLRREEEAHRRCDASNAQQLSDMSESFDQQIAEAQRSNEQFVERTTALADQVRKGRGKLSRAALAKLIEGITTAPAPIASE